MNNDTLAELRKAEFLIEAERKDRAAVVGGIAGLKAIKIKTLPIEAYESVLLHWSNMLTMSSILIELLKESNGNC